MRPAVRERIAIPARQGLRPAGQVGARDVARLHVEREPDARLFQKTLGRRVERVETAIRVAEGLDPFAEHVAQFGERTIDLLRLPGVGQLAHQTDRKGVGWGKSVSVRVDIGGRGSIKKTKYE